MLGAASQPNKDCCHLAGASSPLISPRLCFKGPRRAQSHHPPEIRPRLAGPHPFPTDPRCHHRPAVLLPAQEGQAAAEGAEDRGPLGAAPEEAQHWHGEQSGPASEEDRRAGRSRAALGLAWACFHFVPLCFSISGKDFVFPRGLGRPTWW